MIQTSPNRRPAVFLDRDGTLNEEVARVGHPDELRLIDGAGAAVRRLNDHGLLAVVVTNQADVARGRFSGDDLDRVHARLTALLDRQGARLDGIYHCPHHPDAETPGGRPELQVPCSCRKPETGMIERAVQELDIDLARSWMIGDSTVDLQTARNAGIRALLLRTGHGGLDGRYPARPDFEFDDLEAAVRFVTASRGPA